MYNYGAQSMEYPGSSYNISGGKGASLGTYRNQYYTPGPSSFLDRNKYQMQERSRSNLGNNSSIVPYYSYIYLANGCFGTTRRI